MNGIGIRVSPEQLRQVAAQLNGSAGEIDGMLRQLAAGVEPLGTDWAGVAQAHFLELWADWQRSAGALHQALTGIAQLTAHAATRYESTEQGIATSFNH
jgi:WXG100 family type VII secretion target